MLKKSVNEKSSDELNQRPFPNQKQIFKKNKTSVSSQPNEKQKYQVSQILEKNLKLNSIDMECDLNNEQLEGQVQTAKSFQQMTVGLNQKYAENGLSFKKKEAELKTYGEPEFFQNKQNFSGSNTLLSVSQIHQAPNSHFLVSMNENQVISNSISFQNTMNIKNNYVHKRSESQTHNTQQTTNKPQKYIAQESQKKQGKQSPLKFSYQQLLLQGSPPKKAKVNEGFIYSATNKFKKNEQIIQLQKDLQIQNLNDDILDQDTTYQADQSDFIQVYANSQEQTKFGKNNFKKQNKKTKKQNAQEGIELLAKKIHQNQQKFNIINQQLQLKGNEQKQKIGNLFQQNLTEKQLQAYKNFHKNKLSDLDEIQIKNRRQNSQLTSKIQAGENLKISSSFSNFNSLIQSKQQSRDLQKIPENQFQIPISNTGKKMQKEKTPLKQSKQPIENDKKQKKIDQKTESDIELEKNYQGDESSLQIKSLRNSKSDRLIKTHRQNNYLNDQIKTMRTIFKDKSQNPKSVLTQVNHVDQKSQNNELILKNLEAQNQITSNAIKQIIKSNQGLSKTAIKQKQHEAISPKIQQQQTNSRNLYHVDSKKRNKNTSPKKFQNFNVSEKLKKRSNSLKSNDSKALQNFDAFIHQSDKSSQIRVSFKKNPKISFYANTIETMVANNNENHHNKELNIIQNQSEEYNSSLENNQNYVQTQIVIDNQLKERFFQTGKKNQISDQKSVKSSQTQKSRYSKSGNNKITNTFEKRKLTQPSLAAGNKTNLQILNSDYQQVKPTQNTNNNHILKIKVKKNQLIDEKVNELLLTQKNISFPKINNEEAEIHKKQLDSEIENFNYDIFLKLDNQNYVDQNTQEGSMQADLADENTKIQIQLSFSKFCRFLLIINGKYLDLPQSEDFLQNLNIRLAIENLRNQIDLQKYETKSLKDFEIIQKLNSFDSLVIEGVKYALLLNQSQENQQQIENYYSVKNDFNARNQGFQNQKNDTASFLQKDINVNQDIQQQISKKEKIEDTDNNQFLTSNLNTFRPQDNIQYDKQSLEDNFDIAAQIYSKKNIIQQNQVYSIQNSQSSHSQKYQNSINSSNQRLSKINKIENNYLSLTVKKKKKENNQIKNPIKTQLIRKKSQNVQNNEKQIQIIKNEKYDNFQDYNSKQGNFLNKNMNKYIDQIVKQKEAMVIKREGQTNNNINQYKSKIELSAEIKVENKKKDIFNQFNVQNPYVSFNNKIQSQKKQKSIDQQIIQKSEIQIDNKNENILDLILKEQNTSNSQNTHSQLRRSKKDRQMNSNKKNIDLDQKRESQSNIDDYKQIAMFDINNSQKNELKQGNDSFISSLKGNSFDLEMSQKEENLKIVKKDNNETDTAKENNNQKQNNKFQFIKQFNEDSKQLRIQIDEDKDPEKSIKNEKIIDFDEYKIENGPFPGSFESDRNINQRKKMFFDAQISELQTGNIQSMFHNTGPAIVNENHSSQQNELNSDQREYLNQLQLADVNTQDERSSNQNLNQLNSRVKSSILMIGYPISPKFNSIQSVVSNNDQLVPVQSNKLNQILKQPVGKILGHKNSVDDNIQMANSVLQIEENYDVKKYFTIHQTSDKNFLDTQNVNQIEKSKCSSLSFRNGVNDKFEQQSSGTKNEDYQTVINIPQNENLWTPEDQNHRAKETNIQMPSFSLNNISILENDLPQIFQDQEIPKKSIQDLLKDAMEQLEEQIEEDSDLEDGNYLFEIQKCPKTDHQAILIQAKYQDSVILEESEEHNQSSFSQQHSMNFSHSQTQFKPFKEEKIKLLTKNFHSQNQLKLIHKKQDQEKDKIFNQNSKKSKLFVVEEGQDDAFQSAGEDQDDRNLSDQDQRYIDKHNYPQSLSDLKKIIFSDQKLVGQNSEKAQNDNESFSNLSPKLKINRNQVGMNLLSSKKYFKGMSSSQSWKKYKTNHK